MSLRALALLGLASLAVAAPKADTNDINKRYVEERNGISYNVSIFVKGYMLDFVTEDHSCELRIITGFQCNVT